MSFSHVMLFNYQWYECNATEQFYSLVKFASLWKAFLFTIQNHLLFARYFNHWTYRIYVKLLLNCLFHTLVFINPFTNPLHDSHSTHPHYATKTYSALLSVKDFTSDDRVPLKDRFHFRERYMLITKIPDICHHTFLRLAHLRILMSFKSSLCYTFTVKWRLACFS